VIEGVGQSRHPRKTLWDDAVEDVESWSVQRGCIALEKVEIENQGGN